MNTWLSGEDVMEKCISHVSKPQTNKPTNNYKRGGQREQQAPGRNNLCLLGVLSVICVVKIA
jgi:hypothetical protein